MAVAASVLTYLNRYRVPYQQVHHDRAGSLETAIAEARIDPDKVARAQLLVDARGVVMAVVPASRTLDLDALNERLQRQLRPVPQSQCDRLFRDCEPGSWPALGPAYGVRVLVDESLLEADEVYVESGSHTTLLRFPGAAFRELMQGARKIAGCRLSAREQSPCRVVEEPDCLELLRHKLTRLYRIPPMPATASRLLAVLNDPDSSAADVARIIGQDPALTAQVIRHARSPLYGYRGEIRSVQEAITRVLGFERVSQLALSLCAMKALNPPLDGPLGLNALWRHALACSAVSTGIVKTFGVPDVDARILPMAALLHNFGFFVMAWVCRPEFTMLNKLAAAEPETPVTTLERQVLGMGQARDVLAAGHAVLGGLVLEHWKLPQAVCDVALRHACPLCVEQKPGMLPVVVLANALLKQRGLGDDLSPEPIGPACQMLGLDPDRVQAWFETVELTHSDTDHPVVV